MILCIKNLTLLRSLFDYNKNKEILIKNKTNIDNCNFTFDGKRDTLNFSLYVVSNCDLFLSELNNLYDFLELSYNDNEIFTDLCLKFSDLEKLIIEISKKLSCGKIIITRGHKGSLVYSKKDGFVGIPVFSKEIVDRVGAGDAFFSVT